MNRWIFHAGLKLGERELVWRSCERWETDTDSWHSDRRLGTPIGRYRVNWVERQYSVRGSVVQRNKGVQDHEGHCCKVNLGFNREPVVWLENQSDIVHRRISGEVVEFWT